MILHVVLFTKVILDKFPRQNPTPHMPSFFLEDVQGAQPNAVDKSIRIDATILSLSNAFCLSSNSATNLYLL